MAIPHTTRPERAALKQRVLCSAFGLHTRTVRITRGPKKGRTAAPDVGSAPKRPNILRQPKKRRIALDLDHPRLSPQKQRRFRFPYPAPDECNWPHWLGSPPSHPFGPRPNKIQTEVGLEIKSRAAWEQNRHRTSASSYPPSS